MDATTVYWSDKPRAPAGMRQDTHRRRRGRRAGHRPDNPAGIAVDATSVYWVSQGGSIQKVPLAGGLPTLLAVEPRRLASPSTRPLLLDGILNGDVKSVPIAGGAVTLLASGQAKPLHIAVDATTVYWTNDDPGSLMKLAR